VFILSRHIIANRNAENVLTFIDYWDRQYEKHLNKPPKVVGTKHGIDYIEQLNWGKALKSENVINLLRWKDARFLTHPTIAHKMQNRKVTPVLNKLEILNEFRNKAIDEDTFKNVTEAMFSEKCFIYRIFLFHICRPADYPIADRHVYKAFELLDKRECSSGDWWSKYVTYKTFFLDMAERYGVGKNDNSELHIRKLKKIDNALMAFGKFGSFFVD
jgi:hypothetical protein